MPNSYKLSQGYLQADVLDREEGRNATLRLSFKTEKEKEERREELLYKWELLIRKLLEAGLLTKDTTNESTGDGKRKEENSTTVRC